MYLLDDEGHVRVRNLRPVGAQAPLVAVSPDGSRVAVIWNGPKSWDFTLYDPDTGKPVATSAQDIGFTWALAFNPGRHAHRHRGRGWVDTSVGHLYRRG